MHSFCIHSSSILGWKQCYKAYYLSFVLIMFVCELRPSRYFIAFPLNYERVFREPALCPYFSLPCPHLSANSSNTRMIVLHLASSKSYHLPFSAFLWGHTSVLPSVISEQMGSLQDCPDKDSGLHLVLLTPNQAHLDKIERDLGDRDGSEFILVFKEKEKISQRHFTNDVSKIQNWGSVPTVSFVEVIIIAALISCYFLSFCLWLWLTGNIDWNTELFKEEKKRRINCGLCMWIAQNRIWYP